MPDISAKVDNLKRRFQWLDGELSGLLAHGVRPINVATPNDNGVRSAPAYPSHHQTAPTSSRSEHGPEAPPARGHRDDRIIHTRFCGLMTRGLVDILKERLREDDARGEIRGDLETLDVEYMRDVCTILSVLGWGFKTFDSWTEIDIGLLHGYEKSERSLDTSCLPQ